MSKLTRPVLRLASLAAAALAAIAVVQPAAAAGTDPYTGLANGYDISYPQCPSNFPSGGAFWIVGVNGGKPFTYNSCLGAEWAAAPTTTIAPSLYINTAYSLAYKSDEQAECKSDVSSVIPGQKSKYQEAWVIGCSESLTSMSQFHSVTGALPSSSAAWWLDVESGNSWSSADKTLNQYTIKGALWYLENAPTTTITAPARATGIYSNASNWNRLMGTFSPEPGIADWQASGYCSTAPFTAGSANWLAQGSNGTGFDWDTAC